MNEHLPIFVYGTLQRGEERARCWPHSPLSVERATIRAEIRDLGAYPALIDGDGVVQGELWTVDSAHLEETLRVLDEIECFGKDDVDLYVRKVVTCLTSAGQSKRAYTYYFADPDCIRDKPLVPVNSHGVAHWKRREENH